MSYKDFSSIKKPASLSQEEIAEWQEKDVQKRKVLKFDFAKEHSDEVLSFFVIKPSYRSLTLIADSGKKSVAEGNHKMIELCVLAGPMEELDTDTDLVLGLIEELTSLVDTKKKL